MSLQCLEVVAKLLKGVINVTCATFYFSDILTRPLNRILKKKKKTYPACHKAVLLEVSTFPGFPAGFVFPFDFLTGLRL